jgi:hypothetical protein
MKVMEGALSRTLKRFKRGAILVPICFQSKFPEMRKPRRGGYPSPGLLDIDSARDGKEARVAQ